MSEGDTAGGDVPAAIECVRTLRLKVKQDGWAWLDAAAMEVNTVWNFCNQTCWDAARRTDGLQRWHFSGFDLNNLSAGATEYFEYIGADTIQRVNGEYAARRSQCGKLRLRWRASGGAKRALGWIPFKAKSIKRTKTGVRFMGKHLRVFERARLEGVTWCQGCFAQDATGCWWLCLPVRERAEPLPKAEKSVGIDLGLKDAATTSEGERLGSRAYRTLESAISRAQRRGHRRQAKLLHRRAADQRRDAIHKFSTSMARGYQSIYIGDVSALKLAKTRMAKSVLDSGWGMLKTQLRWKCQKAGRGFAVVDERNTTRACSQCGAMTGPQGLRRLSVRAWDCPVCGTGHDRDINAARNILMLGVRHGPPLAGTSSVSSPARAPRAR